MVTTQRGDTSVTVRPAALAPRSVRSCLMAAIDDFRERQVIALQHAVFDAIKTAAD